METKNFRNLFAVGMTAVSMIVTTAFANTTPSPLAGNRLATTKTHKVIESHLTHIDRHEARIAELKTSIDQNKKADNDAQVVYEKQLLRKECADLKRDKAYLKADKEAYLADQKLAIKEAKKQRNMREAEVRSAKCSLRKDMRRGNDAAYVEDAKHLAILERAVDADDAKVAQLQDDYDEYVAYIKDELKGNDETA